MKKIKQLVIVISILFVCIIAQKQSIIKASDTYTLGTDKTYDGQSTLIATTDKDTDLYGGDYDSNKSYAGVTKIIFQEGVTTVSRFFMSYFPNVAEIEIPPTMTNIDILVL